MFPETKICQNKVDQTDEITSFAKVKGILLRCVNLNLMKKKEKDVVCHDLSKVPINPKGAIY